MHHPRDLQSKLQAALFAHEQSQQENNTHKQQIEQLQQQLQQQTEQVEQKNASESDLHQKNSLAEKELGAIKKELEDRYEI